jgi:uncharacterized OsmC-like protein
MSDDARREVSLERLAKGHFRVTNSDGAVIEVGEHGSGLFTPTELLLVAIASCTGIDVDYITSKRAEPQDYAITMTAEKIRDEKGNRLVDLDVSFSMTFPEGQEGDAAREVLPSAIQRSHERLCTVGRTVEVGTPIRAHIAGE